MIQIPEGSKIEEVMPSKKKRPRALYGKTIKIKSPKLNHALYITITWNEGNMFELFINTRDLTKAAEWALLGRLLSAIFRRERDIAFIVDELDAIYDPAGGYFKDGKYYKSVYAEIATILKEEIENANQIQDMVLSNLIKGTERYNERKDQENQGKDQDQIEDQMMICPKCNNKTAKFENGCITCIDPDCGYSKCDK